MTSDPKIRERILPINREILLIISVMYGKIAITENHSEMTRHWPEVQEPKTVPNGQSFRIYNKQRWSNVELLL